MFITHDMGVVAEIADRVVVMLKGDMVESGGCQGDFRQSAPIPTAASCSAPCPSSGRLPKRNCPGGFPAFRDGEGPTSRRPRQRMTISCSPVKPTSRISALSRSSRSRTWSRVSPSAAGFWGRAVGEVHAVSDVSFDLRAGETLALVGESGCGKSTTGRSILRLIEPRSGSIRFEGRELMQASPAQMREARKRMQMIFQDPFGSLKPAQDRWRGDPRADHRALGSRKAPMRMRGSEAVCWSRWGCCPEHALRFPHEFFRRTASAPLHRPLARRWSRA